MAIILAGIHSLEQHLSHLQHRPEDYRPAQCPTCGKAGLHRHGCYCRKADRDNPGAQRLNPVPIPRFFCHHCCGSCSTLPACIPPRRWYLWAMQQLALALVSAGVSLREAARRLKPARRTLSRWLARFRACFAQHAFALRSRLPVLGRTADFADFWRACLARLPLSEAMAQLHRAGLVVP